MRMISTLLTLMALLAIAPTVSHRQLHHVLRLPHLIHIVILMRRLLVQTILVRVISVVVG